MAQQEGAKIGDGVKNLTFAKNMFCRLEFKRRCMIAKIHSFKIISLMHVSFIIAGTRFSSTIIVFFYGEINTLASP